MDVYDECLLLNVRMKVILTGVKNLLKLYWNYNQFSQTCLELHTIPPIGVKKEFLLQQMTYYFSLFEGEGESFDMNEWLKLHISDCFLQAGDPSNIFSASLFEKQ